jgi:hypothetical protein
MEMPERSFGKLAHAVGLVWDFTGVSGESHFGKQAI